MPSAFDLFGTISLKTNAFESGLRRAEGRLKATDKEIENVIKKSNKLGDTSATIARRIEKLNEGVVAQRNRLLDNALAFEKNEINAKQFASIVTSVDKATMGLNSRLKDMRARLQEIEETKLTHFQQQIQGAMQGSQTTDLFKKLSSYQKGQLAMQGGDVFTQLASGQSPLQVLIQQGPQIAQIFAMNKQAQEGVAAATAKAATSQAAFAASATTSAGALAEASAATTILGRSIVGLAGPIGAIVMTTLAALKAVKDIEEHAKKRLATEEAITGEYNRQSQAIGDLKKRLEEAAKVRSIGRFLQGGSPADLQSTIASLKSQHAAITREVETRRSTLNGILSATGQTNPDFAKDFLKQAMSEGQATKLKELSDQIELFTSRLADLKQAQKDDYRENLFGGAMRTAQAAREAIEKQAVDAAKKRKELVEKAVDDAKKFAEHIKQAGVAIQGIVSSTSGNPLAKIFIDGDQAVQRMLESTKGLGSELQNRLTQLIQAQTQSNAFKQSMENSLKASGLRSEAAEFLGKAKPTLSQSIQRQLDTIGGGSRFAPAQDFQLVNGQWMEMARKVDPNQRARDQKIIDLTRGLADDDLSPALKQQAAAARLREATALDAEKPEAVEVLKDLRNLLKEMKGQKGLQIDISDPSNRTTIGGTSSNVQARYPAR